MLAARKLIKPFSPQTALIQIFSVQELSDMLNNIVKHSFFAFQLISYWQQHEYTTRAFSH